MCEILPNTKLRASKLKRLFNKPFLSNKYAKSKLKNIFESKFVFYDIDDIRESNGNDFDLRNFIKGYINALLYDLENNPEDILIKFDKEAINILKSISLMCPNDTNIKHLS